MPFEPVFEVREEIIHEINLKISQKHLLYLLLTNKAAHWIEKKGFAVKDDTIAVRLPVGEINRVVFRKANILWCMILGSLSVILGVLGILASSSGKHLTWIVVSGVLLILVGRKRRVVEIFGRDKKFFWKEPFYFKKDINKRIITAFSFIRNWAEKSNLTICDYY